MTHRYRDLYRLGFDKPTPLRITSGAGFLHQDGMHIDVLFPGDSVEMTPLQQLVALPEEWGYPPLHYITVPRSEVDYTSLYARLGSRLIISSSNRGYRHGRVEKLLVMLLLRMAMGPYTIGTKDGLIIKIPIVELANFTGSCVEHTGRKLKIVCRSGLVKAHRQRDNRELGYGKELYLTAEQRDLLKPGTDSARPYDFPYNDDFIAPFFDKLDDDAAAPL